MSTNVNRRRVCAAAIGAMVAPTGALRAQAAYPSKPITLIVPFATGGSSDFGARLLAPEMSRRLGQPVVIENIGGAGGALGVQRLVRAAPDGYSLLYGSLSETVLVPLVNPSVGYTTDDLVPLAHAGSAAVAFVTRPNFPAADMDGLIALARSRPGGLTYGSPGIGTFQHVMAETVKARTGTFIVHIPYRGAQPMITDVVGGAVDVGVTAVTNVPPLLAAGRIKVLGVSSAQRLAALPDVQAFGNVAALKGLDLQTWAMLFAPRGTPDTVVSMLNAAIVAASQVPAVRDAVIKTGSTLAPALSPAQARAFVTAERQVYRPIASRIKPE